MKTLGAILMLASAAVAGGAVLRHVVLYLIQAWKKDRADFWQLIVIGFCATSFVIGLALYALYGELPTLEASPR